MPKALLSKFLCIKKAVTWGGIGCCCVIAEGVFVKQYFEDLSSGKEIFLPGVLILVLAVLGALYFSITRVVKYVRMLRP